MQAPCYDPRQVSPSREELTMDCCADLDRELHAALVG
jgi:hypothetical protein